MNPALPLLLALSLAPAAADVHEDALRGFAIEVPEGWTTREQETNADGFHFEIVPPGTGGTVGVTVRVLSAERGLDAETYLARARERVAAAEFSDYEEWEDTLVGREAAGIRVSYRAPSGTFRIVQSFVFENGLGYTLQRHAPEEDYARWEEQLERAVDGFELRALGEEAREASRLAELAARCGSELRWAADWDEAARRSRAEGRPILVVVFRYPGFTLESTPRNSLFMDEDVIELVNERFVPLWHAEGTHPPYADAYGMGPFTFGRALLVVDARGRELGESEETASPLVAHDFLRRVLERNSGYGGTPVPDDLPLLERARRHVARGELDRARELLGEVDGPDDVGALALRARILRLERRGPEALDVLERALAAADPPPPELRLERAGLLARAGREDEARAVLEDVVADAPGTESAAEARFGLGVLALAASDADAARERWRALADARPESRWAWWAAAMLASDALAAGIPIELGWPPEDDLAERLVIPESAPLPADEASAAAAGALAWLLDAQRADGSWLSRTGSVRSDELGPDPFTDAVTALAGRALLGRREVEGAGSALGRALEFALASVESRASSPPRVFYMDYTTWSDAMMLHFLADARDAGLGDPERLAAAAGALVADLATRQREGGGWSYYVGSSLGGADAPAQSISFTTAGAVLALARAREVGFEVPDAMLDSSVGVLERMRSGDGVFSYFFYHATDSTRPETAAPGAVGRGPACELALLRAGKSSAGRVARALELFLEHRGLFAAEQGKALMHAGPDGQGCHYLFFDYAHAARAWALDGEDAKARTRILELVMDCRQPDGSFLDTPINGRAYGTAMALLAFSALDD